MVTSELYTCIYSIVKWNKPLFSKIVCFDKVTNKNMDVSAKGSDKISLFGSLIIV
ncbi:hypothetical protein IB211_03288 [Intestinimonas butyriciproducens]|uniref:Uncharacterized protein n=1 Tax=Intestinimonas butyriciproducens TaxID=1297617 RepID=A0A0S2W8K3_9FIRM|nr:hypothetical protein IB211_03288 [Intestinimonas butyriciproducens]QBB67360.1 hypothetical protein SRB521_03103 [Intestinimonas butyriciproducens]